MSPQDSKVDYAGLKGMSKQDIIAQMTSGALTPPPRGPGRTAFEEFVTMEADSEEREAFIKAQSGEQEPETPESQQHAGNLPDTAPPPAPSDDTHTAPAAAGAPPPEPQDTEPWWKKRGYGSEDEAVSAIDTLRNASEEQRRQIDKRNAEDGRVGRENKELRKKLEALESKAPPADADATAFELPDEAPKPPSIADFDGNMLDDDYVAARSKYDVDMAEYTGKLSAGIRNASKKIADMEGKLDQVSSVANDVQASKAATGDKVKWDTMWSAMRDAQKEFGLETSVDIETINTHALAKNAAWINSLPASDRAAYDKVRQIAYAYADFGEDGTSAPTPRYKTVKGAIADMGLQITRVPATDSVALTPAEEAAQREAKLLELNGTTQVPPVSQDSGGDTPTDGLSDVDASARLMALNAKRDKDPKAFAANAHEVGEFNRLLSRYGMKTRGGTARR